MGYWRGVRACMSNDGATFHRDSIIDIQQAEDKRNVRVSYVVSRLSWHAKVNRHNVTRLQ